MNVAGEVVVVTGLGRHGIRVTTAHPGSIETSISDAVRAAS